MRAQRCRLSSENELWFETRRVLQRGLAPGGLEFLVSDGALKKCKLLTKFDLSVIKKRLYIVLGRYWVTA